MISVIVAARKSADDTLSTIRILLERGCKDLINEPDSLGNTPLHALIVRYALEEARYGFKKWKKWDILHLVRFMLQNGAKSSINQAGNSALACVFRHVRDWEVCYDLLTMLIKEGGNLICKNKKRKSFPTLLSNSRRSKHSWPRWISSDYGMLGAID